jgi:SAM-dependent methyltransferase
VSTLYDDKFYADQAKGSMSSAVVIVPILNELLAVESVLDVGCGIGTWLLEWTLHGADVDGVDGEYVRDRLIVPARFTAHDLTTTLDLGRRFDLVMCLEVAEHLPRRAARPLVESLCRHGDVIAFSAAVPGQGGIGHINLHWPSYWAKLFTEYGYKPYDLIRDRIWWDQRVEWWYRQNILLFATDKAAREHKWQSRTRTLDLAQPALLMPELQPMLKATVCIPWRPTPSRLASFERVKQFWKQFGWPVVTADSDTEIFSLAQARNNAVRKATTDVVIISDADTLIDPLNVLRAAADPRGVWWPFTMYRILSQQYVETPVSELVNVPFVNTWDGQGVAGVGGCIVTTRDEFWRLGGQPPEFIGWGWEDTAFTTIARTLSEVRRLRGCVYAFEHNEQAERYVGAKADSPGWDRELSRNEEHFRYYEAGNGRAWLMRELIAQRDTPPGAAT